MDPTSIALGAVAVSFIVAISCVWTGHYMRGPAVKLAEGERDRALEDLEAERKARDLDREKYRKREESAKKAFDQARRIAEFSRGGDVDDQLDGLHKLFPQTSTWSNATKPTGESGSSANTV